MIDDLLIPLTPQPNQRLSVRLIGSLYDITLRDIGSDLMAITILCDGQVLISNSRALPEAPLIPYAYLSPAGNFVFETENSAYPHWSRFGGTDRLYFSPRTL